MEGQGTGSPVNGAGMAMQLLCKGMGIGYQAVIYRLLVKCPLVSFVYACTFLLTEKGFLNMKSKFCFEL